MSHFKFILWWNVSSCLLSFFTFIFFTIIVFKAMRFGEWLFGIPFACIILDLEKVVLPQVCTRLTPKRVVSQNWVYCSSINKVLFNQHIKSWSSYLWRVKWIPWAELELQLELFPFIQRPRGTNEINHPPGGK